MENQQMKKKRKHEISNRKLVVKTWKGLVRDPAVIDDKAFEEVYPTNPMNFKRWMKFHLFIKSACSRTRKVSESVIVLTDENTGTGDLPEVFVKKPDGEKVQIHKVPVKELVKMEIHVWLIHEVTNGYILANLYANILYPLRMERKRKIDKGEYGGLEWSDAFNPLKKRSCYITAKELEINSKDSPGLYIKTWGELLFEPALEHSGFLEDTDNQWNVLHTNLKYHYEKQKNEMKSYSSIIMEDNEEEELPPRVYVYGPRGSIEQIHEISARELVKMDIHIATRRTMDNVHILSYIYANILYPLVRGKV